MLNSTDKSITSVDLPAGNGLSVPRDAASVFEIYHAMLYHIPTQTYRFYSKCYELAAKEMLQV